MQKRLFQVLHTAPEAFHAPCGNAPGNPGIHGIRVTNRRKATGGTGCSRKPGQQLYNCGISKQNGRAACSSLQPDKREIYGRLLPDAAGSGKQPGKIHAQRRREKRRCPDLCTSPNRSGG